MTSACREVETAQVTGTTDEQVTARVTAHLAHCAACRARVADHDRLALALRAADAPPDEVSRARWLAQMAPTIDDLATRRARPPVRRWIPLAFAVAAAAAIILWFGARGSAPSVATHGLEVLRPYVASGTSSESAKATLLAGRFSALEVAAGELVRAGVDSCASCRLTVIGPARVAVVRAEPLELELASGTLLVSAAQSLRITNVALRTQSAVFAVSAEAAVVFVDRGSLELGDERVAAGGWSGPVAGRSAALVTSLRDHANAIAPPAEPSGILAIAGPQAQASIESGAVLGATPLWARVPAGPLVVIVAGAPEQRTPIEIAPRAVTNLPRADGTTAAAGSAASMVLAASAESHGDVAPVSRDATAPSGDTADGNARRGTHGDSALGNAAGRNARRDGAAGVGGNAAGGNPADGSPADGNAADVTVTGGSDVTGGSAAGGNATDGKAASGDAGAPTASQLYADAERLLATDRAGAERVLGQLLERYPASPQAASALYDLANLARARGDVPAARAALDRLLRSSAATALRDPAAYLRCRLAEAADAAPCFEAFRRNFADSAHDAEVLAWLAGHAGATRCADARPLAAEYLRRYPRGPFAPHARELAACK